MFIGFLPALHLSHCKMRKNSSGITALVFQKVWIPLLYLFTYWKREGESEERDGTSLGILSESCPAILVRNPVRRNSQAANGLGNT